MFGTRRLDDIAENQRFQAAHHELDGHTHPACEQEFWEVEAEGHRNLPQKSAGPRLARP